MLSFICLPTAEIGRMKATHLQAMAGLIAFADADGVCWPGLRKLAHVCNMTLSRVQRAIAEMISLDYLTIEKRGGRSSVYRIARRFLLRQTKDPQGERSAQGRVGGNRPQTSPQPVCKAAESPAGGTQSPASRTERETRTNRLLRQERDVSLPRVARPGFRRVGSIVAPSASPETVALKRQRWLSKLNSWASAALEGEARWAAWQLIADAGAGQLPRGRQEALDALDAMMRRTAAAA